jgi:hypothetical protein
MKKALIIAFAVLACASAPAMATGGGGTGGGTGGGGTGGGGGTTTTTASGGGGGGGTTTTTTGGGTTTTTAAGGGGGGLPNLVGNPGFNPVANPNGHTDWEPWNIGYYGLYKGTGFNGYTLFTQCNNLTCLAPDNFIPGAPWDRCAFSTSPTDQCMADPYLAQAIATTPGKRYDVSFEVAEVGGPDSGFALYWDGQLVALVANPANNTMIDPAISGRLPDAKQYVKFTYPGLLATTSSTVFEFKAYQSNGAMFFGNPKVTLSAVQ